MSTLERIDAQEREALEALRAVEHPQQLEAWRAAHLGGKGLVKRLMATLKEAPAAERPALGKRLNEFKRTLESAYEQARGRLGDAGGSALRRIDMTEPGLAPLLGREHVLTRVRDDLVEIFARMGFAVASGPELEDDEHNFIKLNIPPEHPARDPIDNFYVDDPFTTQRPRMLRSQTSTVQIRVMERTQPPIRVIAPGRVYRPDTVDATHSFMFHQLEGLYVDRGVSMADLKTTLFHFARAYFGEDAEVRLIPSYFPFTEPSAEFYMKIRLRPDEPARWIELGGCGMVDPAVFEAVGYDPEQWTGFAFGFGIDRIAMGKYRIPDIRLLFENDVRFLAQV